MATTTTEFKGNDLAYLAWLEENPDGFVLNSRARPDPDYLILHRARCFLVSRYPRMEMKPGGFTERDYMKVCARTYQEISDWIASHVNGGIGKPSKT